RDDRTEAAIEVVAASPAGSAAPGSQSASQIVQSFRADALAPAVAWLDDRHVVYATSEPAGARLMRLAIAEREDRVLAEFPGEQIVGVRVRAGRLVCVHGRLQRRLLAGRAGALQLSSDDIDGIAAVTSEGAVVTRRGALAVIA